MCVSNAFSIFSECVVCLHQLILSPFSSKRFDGAGLSDVTNIFYIEMSCFLYRDRNEAGSNHRPLSVI